MKASLQRVILCIVPVVLALGVVGWAVYQYRHGRGGFRLGVDLVGGSILVYEVDTSKQGSEGVKSPEELAAALKRRIDPADLYNITIRPVTGSPPRVEIILPTGGRNQHRAELDAWNTLLAEVQARWRSATPLNKETAAEQEGANPYAGIRPGQREELITAIKTYNPDEDPSVIREFVASHFKRDSSARRSFSAEDIEHIKNLVSQQGRLEFRILANGQDDNAAITRAQAYLRDAKSSKELHELEEIGQPPPSPRTEEGSDTFAVTLQGESHNFRYSWVEVGKEELYPHDPQHTEYALNNPKGLADALDKADEIIRVNADLRAKARLKGRAAALAEAVAAAGENAPKQWRDVNQAIAKAIADAPELWRKANDARAKNEAMPVSGDCLMYSREITDRERLTRKDFDQKKYFEYFYLTRDPEPHKEVTGKYLIAASRGVDEKGEWAVHFTFDSEGANLFGELTGQNKPTGSFQRRLAIALDGLIRSAPSLRQQIRSQGMISGGFTAPAVDELVTILRAGALPATLKPNPVSENTMGATLGEDTIRKGTQSVMWAFVAVLAFMVFYYRFAGIVACVALLANLLLTVAFMVLVNATFTLPGLAGLVLTLGMAVDANVLIYERLREERERGASLVLAIRNGYDRAFPTIIDTHLTSIFTAIVLYVVGNDQLKGFGISLTVGLVISLFTSLYMTRTMFDYWQSRNWLKRGLNMRHLFRRPSWDFMAIRYYWFTATVVLTLVGAGLFMARLPNLDAQAAASQESSVLNIDFIGGTAYTGLLKESKSIEELRHDLEDSVPPADRLPDLSIEQVFTASDTGGGSRMFTVRTAEKNYRRVQEFINDHLGKDLDKVEMRYSAPSADGREAELAFTAPGSNKPGYASKAQVTRILTEKGLDNFQLVPAPWLKLADGSISALRKAQVPEAVLKKLEPLKNKEFAFRQDFLAEVGKELDKKDLGRYQDSILKEVVLVTNIDPDGRFSKLTLKLRDPVKPDQLTSMLGATQTTFNSSPQPERLENFDKQLAANTQRIALAAILASWAAILLYLWFRFGSWTFGAAAVLCLIHDLFFTLGAIAVCHYIYNTPVGRALGLGDFKIDLPAVAALLTLVGYSVSDTIVVFDRIREVRGKNPALTPQMINDSVNQTLSRTVLSALTVWLVVIVLYIFGGEGVHLFAFVMVVGVIVGTYSSIYIASPLLLIFGEGTPRRGAARVIQPAPSPA
jgi:SecD/SecF fusion protein